MPSFSASQALGRGQRLLAQGEAAEAAKQIAAAAKADATDARVFVWLGRALSEAGQDAEAAAAFDTAAKLAPDSFLPPLEAGAAAVDRGDRARAAEQLDRAAKLAPDNPLVAAWRAMLAFDGGDAAALTPAIRDAGLLPDRAQARLLGRVEEAALKRRPLPPMPDVGRPSLFARLQARSDIRRVDKLLAKGNGESALTLMMMATEDLGAHRAFLGDRMPRAIAAAEKELRAESDALERKDPPADGAERRQMLFRLASALYEQPDPKPVIAPLEAWLASWRADGSPASERADATIVGAALVEAHARAGDAAAARRVIAEIRPLARERVEKAELSRADALADLAAGDRRAAWPKLEAFLAGSLHAIVDRLAELREKSQASEARAQPTHRTPRPTAQG